MLMIRKMKLTLMVAIMLAMVVPFIANEQSFAANGFYVSGNKLKDANGNDFVIRGINNPHAWYDTQAYNALSTISSKKVNAVRIVWQTSGSAARLQQIIDRCKELGMIAIVELHDVTGSNSASGLNNMASYFASSAVKAVLTGNEKYVLVNIANEWGDSTLADTAWRDAYKTAITTIRNAGIHNTIVVDGSGWGQNSSPIKAYGNALLSHDPDHNVMFSIHMYGSWNDSARIGSELQAIKDLGLAVMIGEFGYNYNNGNNNLGSQVNAQEVMNQSQAKGIGYMAWSWTGNDSGNAWLDMTTSDWQTLTSWGNLVINGTNGIAATSAKASVFSSGTNSALYDFENYSTQGWTALNITGGPWSVTEWAASGSNSLKADVTLGGGQFTLKYTGSNNFSGKSSISAKVKHAPWGNVGSGLQAKLFIKTGASYTWYDSGTVNIQASGASTLTLSLSGVANLGDVREVGVEFLSTANSSGTSAVYVDSVVLQ
ncbi:cellulase family glycosylhydrolase [Paenibacillus sp. PL91]|uniref:cellulase family glycosylhydrolase n=1 Tax=Paenibacillus sp. PL91 TaxID=2729538 RepID=UPI00145DE5BA|nr:cellulase family glycosylhydrolase [Paenibacillus sp. PL91]MBC9201248.1 cellulase family glycosylhydrolase [Paenibacillus sp. PL91]